MAFDAYLCVVIFFKPTGVMFKLALGEKRALSVKSYLTVLGADKANISTLSYGEEKPLDKRHNNEAWGLNRRADFTILSK